MITAKLLEPAEDIKVSLDAPSVGAAAVSSFAGAGPGWAGGDCSEGLVLYLFDRTGPDSGSVVLNATQVPTGARSFARIKDMY